MPTANRVPDDLQHLLPLTPAVFFILFALADAEKHGYAVMQSVSRISDNQFRMGPGTLYSTIQRLLDLDLIEETEGVGGQSDHEDRRRYYKLTRTGKAILAADISRMECRAQFRPDPLFSERLYFCSARANLGINYSSQSHSEENSHEKVIPVCGPSAGRNASNGGPLHT
jgi:DNA-binding PadR family transcriptional regulator